MNRPSGASLSLSYLEGVTLAKTIEIALRQRILGRLVVSNRVERDALRRVGLKLEGPFS